RIGGVTNIIGNDFSTLAMMLRHDHVADHSSGFTDIQLWCPMVVIYILILWIAPFFYFLTDECRDSGIIPYKLEQTFGIIFVLLNNLFTRMVICFRIFPIGTNHIR